MSLAEGLHGELRRGNPSDLGNRRIAEILATAARRSEKIAGMLSETFGVSFKGDGVNTQTLVPVVAKANRGEVSALVRRMQ